MRRANVALTSLIAGGCTNLSFVAAAWNFDEDRASALLLSPLEKFICGGEEPQDALPKLAQLDSAPSVCGRVFKMGEPAYSCRECGEPSAPAPVPVPVPVPPSRLTFDASLSAGIDNTCVLCVDCFKLSPHRHHKYKMGTSAGGGCCDCGDVEAWRSEPRCDVHAVRSPSLAARSPFPLAPPLLT